jgi:anti-sigma factor RsiW
MNCRRVVNLISPYVDGELTGAEMLAIRRHLSDCPECLAECESLRATKLAITRLRTMKPRPDLAACIVSRLDEVSIPRYQRMMTILYRFAARKLSPVAAALAVSGVALAILAGGGQERILVQNSEVVASAPLNLRVENVSYIPKLPDSPIMYSNSKPLVVADHSRGAAFQLAGFSPQ